MTWITELENLKDRPCSDALEWARQYATAQDAWENCERADWMLWYVARVGLTEERHRFMIKAVCQMVRRQLHLVSPSELRPLAAVEAAEAWAENPSAAAAGAARAAAEAAWAAEAAAGAAAWAAGAAAWAAGVTAGAAAEAAAWTAEAAAGAAAEQKVQAAILREYLTARSKGVRI